MTLTPKQFNLLATKDDLKKLEEKLDQKFEGKFDKILTAVDVLAKNVQNFQEELLSNQVAHDRMQKYIESLDKRLTRVELRTGIKTRNTK
jgi:hypothetical protein